MPFLRLRKPGQKDSIDDYKGVLVPLSQANRHPTVAAEYARRRSNEGRSENSDDLTYGPGPKPEEEGDVMVTAGNDMYTIDGLRAEVQNESEGDSAYDCELCSCGYSRGEVY
jgi:hypothetical protein